MHLPTSLPRESPLARPGHTVPGSRVVRVSPLFRETPGQNIGSPLGKGLGWHTLCDDSFRSFSEKAFYFLSLDTIRRAFCDQAVMDGPQVMQMNRNPERSPSRVMC